MGIFRKTNRGLTKTRKHIAGAIDDMLDSFDTIDENLYSELEEILVMGDVGVTTSVQIVEELKDRVDKQKINSVGEIRSAIKEIVSDMLVGGEDMGLLTVPSVILVIGVNGVGKTTTIGKLAAMYKAQGKKVLLGAADTFRAAAIDQLQIWADRAGVEIIKHGEGSDPAAVVFDTIAAGKSRNSDIIIIDTAGRLHNKKNLMEELSKIYRVIDRELPYSDREVLLVLDATTGQNAVNQAREFKEVAEITGIVLTKLDGTARGGVVLAIKNDLDLAVKFIGVGEQIDDLQPFNPKAFADGLFDKIDYKEGEDIEINYSENTQETAENSKDSISEDGQPSDSDARKDESSADEIKTQETDLQTTDTQPVSGYDEEQEGLTEAEIAAEEEAEQEEKKSERKKFFGLFNRHS